MLETEAAQYLGTSRRRYQMLIESGEIFSFKDGRNRKTTKPILDEYIARCIARSIAAVVEAAE